MLGLTPASGAVHAQGEAVVTVHLSVDTSRGEAPAGDVAIHFLDAATRETLTARTIAGSASAQSHAIPVPFPASGAGWLALARAPGWWSPASFIAVDEREATLDLLPAGEVRLALYVTDTDVDRLSSRNVWVLGHVERKRGQLEQGIHAGPCDVERDDSARAIVVACPFARDETADLRVSLGPFLPAARTGVTVASDTDLGWVEPVRGAVATGSLFTADGISREFLLRLQGPRTPGWGTWTDASGVFRFEGLAPGAWELRLVESSGDSWPVRIDSLADHVDLGELRSAATNVLTVSFRTPAAVDLGELKPTVVAVILDDGGKVKVRGTSHAPDGRDATGAFSWRGLPVGDYELQLADARGNRWGRETIHFGGADHHLAELDAVPVVGRIARGRDALANMMVWFGGLWGSERVALRTNLDGQFSGLLPREGIWFAEMTAAPECDPCEGDWEAGGWAGFAGDKVDELGFHEIELGADGIAFLEIELPAGRLAGRVVRRDPSTGRLDPVGAARVRVAALPQVSGVDFDPFLPGEWTRTTDAEGRFEAPGLPDWTYKVHARSSVAGREVESRPLEVVVAGGGAASDVELVLEEQRQVVVVVRSGGVPVQGAQVLVVHDPAATMVNSLGTTKADGSATHYIEADAGTVDVFVRAEGLGMNGWRFHLRDDRPLEVDIAAGHGSLRVPDSPAAWLVSPTGARIRLAPLAGLDPRGQARRDDGDVVLTQLAPGAWRFCPGLNDCRQANVLPWAESQVP